MKLVMWDLAKKSIDSDTLNECMSRHNITKMFSPDSAIRTFRKAWSRFSSIHEKEYQAHRLSDNEVAIMSPFVSEDVLELSHVASVYTQEYSDGATSMYYKCNPSVCGHVDLIERITSSTCSLCSRPIPETAWDIIQEFNRHVGLVSTVTRSAMYAKYVTTALRGCAFLSSGRPYIVPDASYNDMQSFKDALDEVGDKCFILDINEGKGDEGEIVFESIRRTMGDIETEIEFLERRDAFDNRIVKITELMDKVFLYDTVLAATKDQLLEKAENLKAKIREVVLEL